jgi:hypothetical protein
MASAWEKLLREFSAQFAVGTFGRPDASGIRMNGANKKCIARPSNYPYDEDEPDQMYGNPAAYGRSGPSSPSSIHNSITPKDVKYTEWGKEEREDEAIGVPTNFGKSGQGQMGSQAMPGTVGHGWNDAPIKPWDDDDTDEHPNNPFRRVKHGDRNDEAHVTEKYGPMGMHPGVHEVMPPDEIPHNDMPAKKIVMGIVDPDEIVELELPEAGETDPGLHTPDEIGASGYGLPTQIRMFASNPFTSGPGGKSMRHSRYTDLGPSWSAKSESAWHVLARILG